MTSARECRPVGASSDLRLRRPVGCEPYVAPTPVRDDSVALPITLPALVGADKREIRNRVRDFHFEVDPDWSGSTFNVWAGDPRDVIGAVAVSVFQWLRCHGGGTAGVLPWGTTPATGLAVGPLSVTKDLKKLKEAVRNRVNLGGNDLPAALRVTAGRVTDRNALVFVPTDGIEAVTAATHDAVNALPEGSAHLVLIDPLHGCTSAMEADWRSVAFGSVTRIEDLSVRSVATTVAELCAEALDLQLASTSTTTTH